MSDRAEPKPCARRRGRQPEDANERRARVERALRELTEARVPFSMADVAERAGISRATLYRDAALRDLIGLQGNSPGERPVDHRQFEKLRTQVHELAAERRALRRALRNTERRLDEAEKRADEFEFKNVEHERARRAQHQLGGGAEERVRKEAYAEGFAAGARASVSGAAGRGRSAGSADLIALAQKLPRPALLAARRRLVRALHPDLFAEDPAAALLATELLKQINLIAGNER